MIEFQTLHRPTTPNTALFADADDTPAAADRPAPRFDAAPGAVIAAWDRVVRAAPRTTVVAFDPEAWCHHAVQRSRIFRFPDDIHACARADGSGTRLLLYSAARMGASDLGVNAHRLNEWTRRLEAELRKP